MKLADKLSTIEESATLALNTKAKEIAASGKKVYNFTAGEPSTDTPEYIKEYVAGKLGRESLHACAGLIRTSG